jgi:hypothetical protein
MVFNTGTAFFCFFCFSSFPPSGLLSKYVRSVLRFSLLVLMSAERITHKVRGDMEY